MNNQQKAITAIIEALDAGVWDGPSFSLLFNDKVRLSAYKAFEGSLDAALSMHDALLPGWHWKIEHDQCEFAEKIATVAYRDWSNLIVEKSSTTSARAWLIAILKAHNETQGPQS